jgi:hypothetical protein
MFVCFCDRRNCATRTRQEWRVGRRTRLRLPSEKQRSLHSRPRPRRRARKPTPRWPKPRRLRKLLPRFVLPLAMCAECRYAQCVPKGWRLWWCVRCLVRCVQRGGTCGGARDMCCKVVCENTRTSSCRVASVTSSSSGFGGTVETSISFFFAFFFARKPTRHASLSPSHASTAQRDSHLFRPRRSWRPRAKNSKK